MKTKISLLILLVNFATHANNNLRLICRDDLRMENGSLREVVLTRQAEGFALNSQHIKSTLVPKIENERWANKLSCRLDNSLKIGFCTNTSGNTSVSIKERSEISFDSLNEEKKKKTAKFTEINVHENGVQTKSITFLANQCQMVQNP